MKCVLQLRSCITREKIHLFKKEWKHNNNGQKEKAIENIKNINKKALPVCMG